MLTNKDILTPPTFLSYSLGCRTNQAEMEDISLQLTNCGFIPYPLCSSETLKLCPVPSGTGLCISPTVVLLNSCVVTQKAEKETRQKIRELRKKYPESFLVVLGCAVTAQKQFQTKLPKADLFVPNDQKEKLVEIIKERLPRRINRCKNICDRNVYCNASNLNKYQLSGRKFIKIQEGCDRFCSFCLTCLIRGKPSSIPPQEIIKEINFWVDKGIKEIVLTGINLSLYMSKRSDLQGGRTSILTSISQTSISNLIKKILRETKVKRISFSSIDPEMLTDDFLKIVIGNPRITQCLHLSLQSGSSTVLERMNRKTDLHKLLEVLKAIKKQNPFFTFRADIIIGFPDETEKEFEETIDFIKKAKISFVHSFLFSFRPGTKLEGMIRSGKYHEVSSTVKKQRAEILKNAVEKIRKEEAKKMIGIQTNCLIVKLLNCSNNFEGITENCWPVEVRIKNKEFRIKKIKGKVLPVRINCFKKDQLVGEII